jgi:hypothetical protein
MIRTGLAAITVLAALPAAPAFAEDAAGPLQQAIGDPDDLSISASVRVRYESLANQFRPGLKENADIVVIRSTLAAEYDAGPVRIGGELIDARAYSADRNGSVGTGEVNALELVQAYVGLDLDDALGKGSKTSIDLGRFTMDLGSRRLVSRNNFRNTTNAFAGARVQAKSANGGQYTVFYTLPLIREPSDKEGILHNEVEWDRESFDLTFWGAFASQPIGNGITLEGYLYGLNERDSHKYATRNRKLYTPGLRLFTKPAPGKWDVELEAAYQFGSIRESTAVQAPRQKVSAYTVHAELGYQFAASWSPRLALEYDRASGDKPGGRYGRFDNLYGSRRSDFGPTSTFGALGRNNISSLGARLEFTPDARWDGFLHYSANWLDSAYDSFATTGVRDPAGQSGAFAGHEIEARVRYWVVPKLLRLDTGGAVIINGRFLDDAPNANHYGNPLFGYVELTASF